MSSRFRQVPTVELIGPGGTRRLYEIETDTIRIGRDPVSEIPFANDLFVSWKHAKIKRMHDGSFLLIDLESQNKTSLDGQLLKPNRPLVLRDGSRIGVAQKHELVFHFQAVGLQEVMPASTVMNAVDDLSSASLVHRSTQPARALEAVLEVNRALGGAADLNEMLGRALDGLMALFPVAERGFILTVEQGDALMARAVRRARGADRPLTVSQTMLRRVLDEGKALIIDTTQDPRYKEGDSVKSSGIGIALCAPLPGHDGRPVGVVQLDSPVVVGGFQTDDLELLAALAIPLGVAVENHGLLKEQVSLTAARQIAEALLPEERPRVPGYSFWEY
jgi:sigma-B regulation protein RsbU (phosphoserine phosphatase)